MATEDGILGKITVYCYHCIDLKLLIVNISQRKEKKNI